MYKNIFQWVIQLVSQPAKAWEQLREKEEDEEEFLSRFVYPLIGLLAVVAFLGIMFTRKEADLQLALKTAIHTLLVYFGGFFLSVYLLGELWVNYFKREKNVALCQRFVGYSSSLMYALSAVLMLIPEFFFLQIFVLYTFYIVWEGATVYMEVEESERLRFSILATALVVLLPTVIGFIIRLLMPGLQS